MPSNSCAGWVTRLRGDLGRHFATNRTVNELIGESFHLGRACLLVVARRADLRRYGGNHRIATPNTAADYIPSSLAMIGISLPNFVWDRSLFDFRDQTSLLRVSGWDEPTIVFCPRLLSARPTPPYCAAHRGGMLEILSQDFIAPRARKVRPMRALFCTTHARRLIPVVSIWSHRRCASRFSTVRFGGNNFSNSRFGSLLS